MKKDYIALADQVLFSGFSFLTTILMAKLLTPENFGIFSTCIIFIYLLIAVLNALVIQPLQVSLPKIHDSRQYLSFNALLQLFLMLTVLLIFIILIFSLPQFKGNKDLDFTAQLIFSFGFIQHDYFRKLFLAQSLVKRAFLFDLFIVLLQLTILFILHKFNALSLTNVFYFFGFSYLPLVIVGLKLSYVSPTTKSKWKMYGKMHFDQGKWLVSSAMIQWWSSNLFVLTSGLVLGMKALGAFRLVQSLFGILNLVVQTMENYVLPEAARRLTLSESNAKNYLKEINLKSILIFLPILLLLFLFSEQIIVLVGGEKYHEFSFVIQGMCFLYFIIILGYPIRLSIRMLVLNKIFLKGYLISFLFSLFSYHFLLNNWGISGAIIGLITTQIISLLYWQYELTKKNFRLWK